MARIVFLQLLALVACFPATHGHHAPSILGLNPVLSARFNSLFQHEASHSLEGRDSGQACGIQNGNTSCPAGQCCSAQGQCGTARAYCDAPYCQFEFGPACDANMAPQGTDTSFVPRPALGSVKYADGGIVYNCTKPGHVALTFDDGPYHYTAELLDTLQKNNVSATFFLTGNNIGKHPIDWAFTGYPAIIQRMITDGHQVASHTWSHQDLNTLSTQERHDQMVKMEMALVNILGFWPTYMRPPYNSCQKVTGCLTDIAALGYHVIEYNVRSYDYENLTPESYPLSQNNVTTAMQGGNPASSDYIVFSHDILPMTVNNLTQWMIDTIKGQGYQFATVGDCLGDPMTNWYRDPASGQALTEVVINPANLSLTAANLSASVSSAASGSASGTSSQPASKNSASQFGIDGGMYMGLTGAYLMLLAVSVGLLW